MKLSNYSIRARYFPAIINSIPFIIIVLTITNQQLKDLFNNIIEIKIISDISMSIIFLYFIAQLQRIFSKELFEKLIFDRGLSFPTTTYLLLEDETYSLEYKQKIREKIFADFEIDLPNIDDERDNKESVCKKIVEAVSLVRRKVGDGTLTLQHNIEYGFIRNLVGGSILGILGSVTIFILYVFNTISESARVVSIILFIIYFLILILSKILLKKYSNLYANVLYQDYLTMK